MRAALLALVLALAAVANAAEKPRWTADQVFRKVLEAQESQAWLQAKVSKREGPAKRPKEAQVTEGELRALPGGKARLEIAVPAQGLILADGRHLWVELAEVEQVMKYDQAKLAASGNFFLDLASSIRHYSKAGLRRLIKPGEGFDPAKVSAIELLPLRPQQAGFERLRVWVEEERWVVLRVLLDYGGTRSDVRFSGIRVLGKDALAKDPGQGLDPALFKYKPPKGFEVFDLDL